MAVRGDERFLNGPDYVLTRQPGNRADAPSPWPGVHRTRQIQPMHKRTQPREVGAPQQEGHSHRGPERLTQPA